MTYTKPAKLSPDGEEDEGELTDGLDEVRERVESLEDEMRETDRSLRERIKELEEEREKDREEQARRREAEEERVRERKKPGPVPAKDLRILQKQIVTQKDAEELKVFKVSI